ncbi:MAG: adenylate/guanylate cyclase domain-containing protein [Bacteroidetes bacterium]|nr:adenylate/guanylate cyclase domain-containing protein [Bacteroidota bacterium]
MASSHLSDSSVHKLAAIMFTDIVGYTALVGADEASALELLRKSRSIQQSLVLKYKGKWLKEMGDGVLAEFSSAYDSARCAIAIQEKARKDLGCQIRIGIHLGDVTVENGDIFGDGVNIASRLQSIADPGGIYVSESIQKAVRSKADIDLEYFGEVELKNVSFPVKTYFVKGLFLPLPSKGKIKGLTRGKESRRNAATAIAAVLIVLLAAVYWFAIRESGETNDEIKSIAVLPFENMSGDPENEPFCDGMTDEVIKRLSRISSLEKVISRTTVMKFKGTDNSASQIAEELGVTNILESSFQKLGEKVKINLSLINPPNDNILWSYEHEYEGEWDEKIFKFQADVAETVAKKLGVKITDVELESIQKMPTNSKEAYNLFLQAEFQRFKSNEHAFKNAIPLYNQAIALDSNFTEAYIGLGSLWHQGGLVWGIYNEQEAWEKSKKLHQIALEIDSTNVEIKDILYSGYFYYDWNFNLVEKYYQTKKFGAFQNRTTAIETDYAIKTGRSKNALIAIDKNIATDPSVGTSYSFKAEILMYLGRKEEAINLLKRVDPFYVDDPFYLRSATKLYYYLEEYEKSRENLEKFMANFTDRPPILTWLQAVYHNMDGSKAAADKNLKLLLEKYEKGDSGSPAWFIALYYCTLEDYENAFLWLQKSYDRHEVEMTWLREEPLLIPLRDDLRYKELYRKVGFSSEVLQ